MSTEKEELPQFWDDLIKTYLNRQGYQSRTCKIYNIQRQNSSNGPNTTCVCGRLAQRHSFSGESHQSIAVREGNRQWQPPNVFRDLFDGVKVPIDVFGRLKSTNCKFVRISIQTKLKDIYDLLVADCKGCQPKLILSVFGGAKYFTMTERLEKEIIRGIVDAASATGR